MEAVGFFETRLFLTANQSRNIMYIQVYILCIELVQINTRLFKMIVGVLTTCHTQYT